jgi:hypothetical protein
MKSGVLLGVVRPIARRAVIERSGELVAGISLRRRGVPAVVEGVPARKSGTPGIDCAAVDASCISTSPISEEGKSSAGGEDIAKYSNALWAS